MPYSSCQGAGTAGTARSLVPPQAHTLKHTNVGKLPAFGEASELSTVCMMSWNEQGHGNTVRKC